MVYLPKRAVEVFFFFLSFSFLVFGFWFLTVALLAWRVVFSGGHWVGLGWGWGYIQLGESFFLPSTGLQTGTCYLSY